MDDWAIRSGAAPLVRKVESPAEFPAVAVCTNIWSWRVAADLAG